MIYKKSKKNIDGKCVGMLQTHGNNVHVVSKKDTGKDISDCDGLITADPDVYLKISVADCLPIFIYASDGSSIALIHAGWRGLYKGIIKNAVELIRSNFSVNTDKLIIYIGSHICQNHYEIKDDVAALFKNFSGEIKSVSGKIFLNLAGVAKKQFLDLGAKAKNITIDAACTFENSSLASFRRGDLNKRNKYLFRMPEKILDTSLSKKRYWIVGDKEVIFGGESKEKNCPQSS